jgi:uncharacterized membrane protein
MTAIDPRLLEAMRKTKAAARLLSALVIVGGVVSFAVLVWL